MQATAVLSHCMLNRKQSSQGRRLGALVCCLISCDWCAPSGLNIESIQFDCQHGDSSVNMTKSCIYVFVMGARVCVFCVNTEEKEKRIFFRRKRTKRFVIPACGDLD